MPTTWTPDRQNKMLAHIFCNNDIRVNYEATAAYMGEGITAKAIQHRIAGIKAAAREFAENPADGNAAPKEPTPKTPKTPRGKTTPKGKSPSAKKAGKRPAPELDDDDTKLGGLTSYGFSRKKQKRGGSSMTANDGSRPQTPGGDIPEAEPTNQSASKTEAAKTEVSIKTEVEDSATED